MCPNQQRQLQWLNDIFSKANYSPVFRPHDGVPEGMIAYISLDDVLNYQYESIEALVSDGWELD